jgi:hypothetical protein
LSLSLIVVYTSALSNLPLSSHFRKSTATEHNTPKVNVNEHNNHVEQGEWNVCTT